MKKIIWLGAILTFLIVWLFLFYSVKTKEKKVVLVSPLAEDKPQVFFEEKKSLPFLSPVPILSSKTINILFLGVDGRRGDKNPRCDAIHLLSLDLNKSQITITSIPRGTTVKMENIASESAYLGNSCHIMGVDFAISQIEKISAIHPDYLIKLGFSQSLGILRSLDLPTTETLQFLRNRRYGLGDYQRSHNQAVFLKDMFITYLPKLAATPKVMRYLLFQMVDTDMPFETASFLLEELLKSEIYKNPEKIKLVTKPVSNYKIRDLHFEADKASTAAELLADKEYQAYQNDLVAYLNNLIGRGDKFIKAKNRTSAYNLIKVPFSQKLWLQVDDRKKRNQLHFDLLRVYALSTNEKTASSQVLDFITEMEEKKEETFKKEAEELLSLLNQGT